MTRRNMMTGIVAVLAIGFLSLLAPATGADYSASTQGSVRITIQIPQVAPAPQLGVPEAPDEQESAASEASTPPEDTQEATPQDIAPERPTGTTEQVSPKLDEPSEVEASNESSGATEDLTQKEVHEDSDVPEE